MKNIRNLIPIVVATLTITALSLGAVWSFAETTATAQEKTTSAKSPNAPVPVGTYKLDPAHSIIGFAIRHLEINWVEGRFKDFVGTINYNAEDVTRSTVEFTATIESIDTGVDARNKHLKTADFFDAAKYPAMTFKSTSIERRGKEGYMLNGDLTLKGVTKQVSLPFTMTGAIKDPWGNTRFGIEAHTKINRRDFGINYGNQLPGGRLDVGNEVTINFQLEAMKPEPKPAG